MKGTLTLIVGPPKCGKTALASFLVRCNDGPACILYWDYHRDAAAAKRVLGDVTAQVEEGWHVIVTATMAKGRPVLGGSTGLRAAANQVIELRSYCGRDEP